MNDNRLQFEFRRLIQSGAVALVLAATTTASMAQSPPQLTEAMKANGGAKVAIAATPPYAFMGASGEPQGYLIDVSTAVLKSLGVPKLQAVVTTWDAMIPGLQAKQYDFLPPGLNVTAARCQVVAFTVPVTAQQDAMYVKPGNPKKILGYAEAAKLEGVQIAVLAGSSQEAFALKQQIPQSRLVKVPDVQAGIAAVTGGRADAFIAGQFTVSEPAKRGVEAVVDGASPVIGIALAFRKEDAATRDAFDTKINALKADGTLQKLYSEKYGFTNWPTLAKLNKASDLVPECN